MFKYTKYLLEKLEQLFSELGYVVRYERGNFQSGYCIVRSQRIVVINRFFDTEARINTLLEILDTMQPDESALSEAGRQTYQKVKPVLQSQHATAGS